ncbi:unnamed protein product [Prunus armeniaca]
MDDSKAEVQDPLLEINLGTEDNHRPIYISGLMEPELLAKMEELLREFKDCFAWDYTEMPELSRDLVEHRLPTVEDFKPFKQPPRRMSAEVELQVKEEIVRLVKAKFIRPARYVEWLSNIVPVKKKTGAIRICVDFRNLNLATPKDEYPMPMADLLVDGAAKHEILSFMDGHSGYNQIFIAEEDVHKTAFRCPGSIGTFEYVVMPFGLKNAGATYQRAMNSIFHDMIGRNLEVYIDDVVIKSESRLGHVDDLRSAFERMRRHQLKMNPKKCAFGVSAGNFLGFLVHQRGIEIDKNKAKAIINAPPPKNKKGVQSLLGQINFLRRFIANSAGKVEPFSSLLKLKDEEKFRWEETHQRAFDAIKEYLAKPPVLIPPKRGRPLKLYISAAENSIGSLLAQDNDEKKEQAVYYLSRILTATERKYSPVEKLCLALYFTATKLRHYMLPSVVHIIAKTDLIKYMLTRPIIRGRIGKWTMALAEFTFRYVPQQAVKGQALADFLAAHPCVEIEEMDFLEVGTLSLFPWRLYFDGSRTFNMGGAGVIIETPKGFRTRYSFQLDFDCTNNQAEYEALIIGLEILKELGVKSVAVMGDSMLVLKQLSGDYKVTSQALLGYHALASQLMEDFDDVRLAHLPREHNTQANAMAQLASGVEISEGLSEELFKVEKRSLPSVFERGVPAEVMVLTIAPEDWRHDIVQYLKNPNGSYSQQIRRRAQYYVIRDEVLFRIGSDDLLMKCLGKKEQLVAMTEVHEGICGAHQAGIKMRWLLRRHGYYWPTILKDCIEYAKGCKDCQRHGPIQHVPAGPMNPIVKAWPFKGWAMDVIGQIYPKSSKGHKYILVATDFFTKWVEAVPLKQVTQVEVIEFIEKNIIHRFGLPESIMTDRGTAFMGEAVQAAARNWGIRMVQSTPYNPQSNGQAEASNKVIKGILEKMIDKNPKEWHSLLSNSLWAYRTSKRSATQTTPFALTYGHDAVLPLEISVKSLRVVRHAEWSEDEYGQAMAQELDDLDEVRLGALDRLKAQKEAVARAYDKKTKAKSFGVGDLVWKTILPVGSKDPKFGKWSPTWEGPFLVHQVLGKGAYKLSDQNGRVHDAPINGRFLKKYYPTVWEMAER